jgi:Ca2+-binding RTX toxin-like protein
VFGGNQADIVVGGPGTDTIQGGLGNDVVDGREKAPCGVPPRTADS